MQAWRTTAGGLSLTGDGLQPRLDTRPSLVTPPSPRRAVRLAGANQRSRWRLAFRHQARPASQVIIKHLMRLINMTVGVSSLAKSRGLHG